ncbi:NUDIX hydrolase [Corticicoccus populi]|uniref:NUDIX domain-containing protein n=1 Tax=Corticicoccus populi TaxID=1812821 RepID=A0ABW5WY83_9STAP
MEIWDAYDSNGKKQSMELLRGESIPPGSYHLVSEVVILNKGTHYLAMQRDTRKTYPGLYEISAGGSVLKGETSREGAVREAGEETGIHIEDMELKYITVSEAQQTIYHCYKADVDVEKEAVQLQDGETMGYQWIERAAVESFLNSSSHVPGYNQRVMNVIGGEVDHSHKTCN